MTEAVPSDLQPERRGGIAQLLFGFGGRTGRRGYWIGIVIALAIAVLALVLGGDAMNTTGGNEAVLLGVPLLALFVWMQAAVTIKRLRDAELPAWTYLALVAVPLAVAVAAIEFAETLWMLILLVIVAELAITGVLPSKTP